MNVIQASAGNEFTNLKVIFAQSSQALIDNIADIAPLIFHAILKIVGDLPFRNCMRRSQGMSRKETTLPSCHNCWVKTERWRISNCRNVGAHNCRATWRTPRLGGRMLLGGRAVLVITARQNVVRRRINRGQTNGRWEVRTGRVGRYVIDAHLQI